MIDVICEKVDLVWSCVRFKSISFIFHRRQVKNIWKPIYARILLASIQVKVSLMGVPPSQASLSSGPDSSLCWAYTAHFRPSYIASLGLWIILPGSYRFCLLNPCGYPLWWRGTWPFWSLDSTFSSDLALKFLNGLGYFFFRASQNFYVLRTPGRQHFRQFSEFRCGTQYLFSLIELHKWKVVP